MASEAGHGPPRGLALKASSRAIETREPRQDRKVAAVSDQLDVPRIQLTGALSGGALTQPVKERYQDWRSAPCRT